MLAVIGRAGSPGSRRAGFLFSSRTQRRIILRTIAVLFLLAAGVVFEGRSAAAVSPPGNGIVITNLSNAAQSTRPFTISRVFAQGEFPSGTYPQARISGTSVLTQANVKNTWAD